MKAFLYSFRINAVPLVPWIWNQQSVFSLWPNAFKQKMFRLGTQLIYYPNNIHLGSSCQNWIIYMFRTHANGAHITTRNGFKHKIITGSGNPTLWCIWQHNPWKFLHLLFQQLDALIIDASSATWYNNIFFSNSIVPQTVLQISPIPVQTCPWKYNHCTVPKLL